ncbi:MAG: transglycosylase SLT domain-containing protein, partial [Janthinobacterium lividum]
DGEPERMPLAPTFPARCSILGGLGTPGRGTRTLGAPGHGARALGALGRRTRTLGALGMMALLAACASQPQMSATQEAAQYASHARGDYTPPGPSDDPWGPYITEASSRFDVPDRWIREVMRVESGGRLYHAGGLVTSPVGAMGLMQVMPATFDEMRVRYSIGDDPYDPHNSILAGAAYIREMYDVYGSPGFLAAYNAGPGNLDAYLTRNRPLPAETRRYVAMIAPYIRDSSPNNRSQADMLAMNQLPSDIPAGPRFPARAYARAEPARPAPTRFAERLPEPPVWAGFAARPAPVLARGPTARPAQFAAMPVPPRSASQPSYQVASFAPARHDGLHLISPAMAESLPRHGGGADWAIQVGAFGNMGQAHAAAGAAREVAQLGAGRPAVAGVREAHGTLYRARLTGLSRESALHACEKLARGHQNCMVVAPDSQS